MERNEGIQFLQVLESSKEKALISPAEFQGLAGWAWRLLRLWRSQREAPRKQLRLVESLALGGKRTINVGDVCRRELSSWGRSGQCRDNCAPEGRYFAGCYGNESG